MQKTIEQQSRELTFIAQQRQQKQSVMCNNVVGEIQKIKPTRSKKYKMRILRGRFISDETWRAFPKPIDNSYKLLKFT